MFREFSNTKFVLHYLHDKLKINIDNNVEVKMYDMSHKKQNLSFDQLSEA